jgi:holo-[acyl-carrier-protein] synthase
MIYGIGTDLCDIRRISAAYARHGDKFVQRILGSSEQAEFTRRSERWPDRGLRYLASRFSAKEAFSKAIGLGIHSPMRWSDCEITNASSGKPHIRLSGNLNEWCAERHLQFHVTLSDESDYVVSFVVAETA